MSNRLSRIIGRPIIFIGIFLIVSCLQGCNNTQPPPSNFGISVKTKPISNENGTFEITINGTGFSSGGSIKVSYANVPNRPGVVDGSGTIPVVQNDGTFIYQEALICTSHDPQDGNGSVFVNVKDIKTGNFAPQNISARDWVCPR
jgi:hypothetical protein